MMITMVYVIQVNLILLVVDRITVSMLKIKTKQIGIMKAVGARNSDVLLMFVIEAGLLGLIGGIIGVILGIGMSIAAEYVIKTYLDTYYIYVSVELVVGALLFSFIVGCISGYFPAKRASKMHPVDALRYR